MWCGDALCPAGRESSPSWSAFGWRCISTAGDRGSCRRQITWSQFFPLLHHNQLQAPAQTCNCFSGTEWRQAPCRQAIFRRRGAVCLTGSFKICSFESQPRTGDKTQDSCGAKCVIGVGTQVEGRNPRDLGHRRGDCSHFCEGFLNGSWWA